jgi:hypothetical protein
MTQAAILASSASSGVSTGFKNRVINGGMVINQRGTTSGVTSGYFVDRWQLSGCSTSSVLTSSLPTGFSKGISITATSGNPIAIHKIEAANCSDLSGQSVTLSFYAQNVSNATTLYASLAYATSADNFGGTTTISEQNLGTLTGSWVRYTYTWNNLPSGVLNGLSINILCGGSGTFTMGITGVQLEVGTTATNFEYRDYGNELRMCQRYYYVIVNQAPVGSSVEYCSASFYSATELNATVMFPVTMRTPPSIVQTSGTNYHYVDKAGTSLQFNSWTGMTRAGPNSALLYLPSLSGYVAGYGTNVYSYNNSTFVAASAEL